MKRFAGPNIILNNFGLYATSIFIGEREGKAVNNRIPFFRNDNQKYRIEAIDQNTTKTVVEKFGITFTRTSNED